MAHFLFGGNDLEDDLSRETLLALLEPAVNALGYDLVDIVHNPGPKNGLLRLYIDKEPGVTIEDCETVSRQIGALLDVEDPIRGEYALEVSSPGERRHLRTPAHFERFLGARVKVQLKLAQDGRRRFSGRLEALDDDTIVVDVDGTGYRLPLEMIDKATLISQG